MRPVVVLIAPPSAVSVVAVLMDWSALGLVRDFLWVQVGAVEDQGPIGCLKISAGRSQGAIVQDELPKNLHDGDPNTGAKVRICGLVPFGETSNVDASLRRVFRGIQAAGHAHPVPIRVVLPRDEVAGPTPLAIRAFHNVIISPESSRSPLDPSVPLDLRTMAETGAHEAAGVASLAGLWVHTPGSPLDGRTTASNLSVRLARTQIRSWEGRSADERLRRRTLFVGDTVPVSATAAGTTAYVPEDAAYAERMAKMVWEVHSSSFKSEREQPRGSVSRHKSIGEILVLFWSFVVAGLKDPKAWLAGVLSSVQTEAADQVGRVLLGEDSSIDVVWSDRTVPTPENLSQKAADLSARLTRQLRLPQLIPTSDFPRVWEDYVHAALTMMDGRDRGSFTAPAVGRQAGVVRRPDSVVPRAQDVFARVDSSLDTEQELRRVEKYDPLAQQRLRSVLDELSDKDHYSGAAVNSRLALDEWIRESASLSYAAAFATRLAEQIEAHRREVRELSMRFMEMDAGPGQEVVSGQRGLARKVLMILGIGALLAMGLTVAAFVFPDLSRDSIAAAIGVTVGAFVIAAWTFVRAQQKVFAALHRREQLALNAETLREDLRGALQDIVRCSDAYEQLRSWNRVLGEFLHAPFGRSGDAPQSGSLPEVLPDNTFFGSLQYLESEELAVSSRLRESTFAVGWLGEPYDALLGDAGRRIGPDAFQITEAPRTLYQERHGGSGSILGRWASAVTNSGVGGLGARLVWRRVSATVLKEALARAGARERVIDSRGEVYDAESLVTELDARILGGPFDARILEDSALMGDANLVEGPAWVATVRTPVATEIVRVEFSRELAVDAFLYKESAHPRARLEGSAI